MARHYKDWIKAYLHYTSKSESPTPFHIWTAVSCIAGALRRRVRSDQVLFEWIPNFYIIFVAEPGIVGKSTTADIGMDLLAEVPDIHMGPHIATWQAIATAFGNSVSTIMLPDGNMDTMSAMTIVSAELGNLLNPKDGQLVDFLVRLWDCKRGTMTKITKMSGNDEIRNPFINIIGCTTPSWIAQNIPPYMIGGGFTARCIFVHGTKKRDLVAMPGRAMRESNLIQMRQPLIEDLTEISNIAGTYDLTREGYAWMEIWYKEHNKQIEAGSANAMAANYMARKQTFVMKLAMVLTASKTNDLWITDETLHEALTLLEIAERDIPKVFNSVGLTNETRALEGIINAVKRAGKISYMELYRQFQTTLMSDDFDRVLKSAINTGEVERRVHTNGSGAVSMLHYKAPPPPAVKTPESGSPSPLSEPPTPPTTSPSLPSALPEP